MYALIFSSFCLCCCSVFFFAINGREGGGEGRRRAGDIVNMKVRCRQFSEYCAHTHTHAHCTRTRETLKLNIYEFGAGLVGF